MRLVPSSCFRRSKRKEEKRVSYKGVWQCWLGLLLTCNFGRLLVDSHVMCFDCFQQNFSLCFNDHVKLILKRKCCMGNLKKCQGSSSVGYLLNFSVSIDLIDNLCFLNMNLLSTDMQVAGRHWRFGLEKMVLIQGMNCLNSMRSIIQPI